MNRSRGKGKVPGSPSMDPNTLPGQTHEWYQNGTRGRDENAFLDAQDLNTMHSSHPSHFHASFSSLASVQPDLGNWQPNTGMSMRPDAFQAHPDSFQQSNQGEVALVPCVVCTRRMAKFKPTDKRAKEKTACHDQSKQGTKACSACSRGGRGCIQIEDPRLEDLAMKVQWAFQRVQGYGGHYTREDNQYCKWVLDGLERKYPSKAGSKRR